MVETKEKYFIIDFDSTFTKVEALDVLVEISLEKSPNRDEALQEIKNITDQGMDGTLDLRQSLEKRIEILKANIGMAWTLGQRRKLSGNSISAWEVRHFLHAGLQDASDRVRRG